MGSVRGYTSNSLGPKGVLKFTEQGSFTTDTNGDGINDADFVVPADPAVSYIADGNTLGGNLLTEASMELVFPLPFVEDQRSMRSVLFFDVGNVFDTQCLVLTEANGTGNTNDHPACVDGFDVDELRMGAGASLTWVTAIGPLTFTFARSLNSKTDDLTEGFEFSLGQVF